MRFNQAALFLAAIALLGGTSGVLYAYLTDARSWPAGAIYGGAIGLTVSCVERGLVLGGIRSRIRRWPTWVYIPVCEVGCVALVCVGFALGGSIVWWLGLTPEPFFESVVPNLRVLLYALLVAGALIFVTRVRDLLGHSVFVSLLTGRYHKPVEERRIFLFLDLVGSTAYAEAHGDLQAQRYLGAIFAAFADAVRRHAGTIDDYIGDMALITWTEAHGVKDENCIRCVFEIFAQFERDALHWHRSFGQAPAFRAALHGGSVVTAEVGVDRHKISFFGDVVNTTARIETLCRHLEASVLISGDLPKLFETLPPGIEARSFGVQTVRGRGQALEVFGLERVPLRAAPRRLIQERSSVRELARN